MTTTLIKDALIINEGRQYKSDILIKNDTYKIAKYSPKKLCFDRSFKQNFNAWNN